MTTGTPTRALERDQERQLAVDLFNHVWARLEKPDRTSGEDEEMAHAAHASLYHWSQVGTPVNRARGEWQISRVYAVVGRAEPALHHARRCLEICGQHAIADFDLAFAHEALARAHAIAGDAEATYRHIELARQAATDISEADDRDLVLADLASIPTPTASA